MLVKNYTTPKERDMNDNDIHYQFVDFIVRTALLHKELDRSTSAFPTAKKMSDSFDAAVDLTLNKTLTQIDNFDSSRSPNQEVVQNIITTVRNSLNGRVGIDDITYEDLLNTAAGTTPNNAMSKTYYDFLCAAVFSLSYQLLNAGANKPINAQTISILKNAMNAFVGNCKTTARGIPLPANAGQNQSEFGNLCYMTYWNKEDPRNSAVQNLSNLLGRVEKQVVDAGIMTASDAQTNMDAIHRGFLNDMKIAFETQMLEFALQMYRDCGLNDLTDVDNLWNEPQQTPQKLINFFQHKVMRNSNLRNKLTAGLKTKTHDALLKAVSAAGVPAYRNIGSTPESDHFCSHVLGLWKDLNREAREFYRSQIAVFKRYIMSSTPAGAAKAAAAAAAAPAPAKPFVRPLANQWIGDYSLLDDDRQMEKIDCDKQNIRLNLLKKEKGSDVVMFCYTLPFLPVNGNHVGNLWYTDNTGAKRSIKKQNLTVDVLKVIYDGVYKDVTDPTNPVINININNAETMTVPGHYDLVIKDSYKNWDHNLTLIVKNGIKPQVKSVSRKAVSIQELLETDTGMVWFSDDNGLYTVENGKKVPYAVYKQREKNCDNVLALNEKKVNAEQCREIAQCIIDSPDKLPECLKSYEKNGYDIFEVAQNELRKMDPDVAKTLLEVFHVGIVKSTITDKNGNVAQIVRPRSYTEWTNRVLNAEEIPKGWTAGFKKNLRESSALLNYIKGVIEFVRSNPAILNHENINTGNMDEEVDDDQLKILRNSNYNIGTYMYPYVDTIDELKYNSGFLIQSATAFAPVPTTFSMPFVNNAFVGDGVMSSYGLNSMGGGAIPEGELMSTSHIMNLKDMMQKLIIDLRKKGLSFNREQEQEINNFINELGRNEQRLKEMIQVLTNLRNLQNFVRCYDSGRHSGLTSGKVLALDEIVSHRDLLEWLNSNIGDYENCIYKGMEYINAGSQQVLNTYNDLIQASSYKQK